MRLQGGSVLLLVLDAQMSVHFMIDQNDWYLISVAFSKSYLSVHGGDYKSNESR